MQWLASIALGLVLFLASPSLAQAQTVPPDLVVLTNGGVVRGVLIEHIPGDHVTIQLVTGEVRIIPAVEVASVGPAVRESTPPLADRTMPTEPSTPRSAIRFDTNAPGISLGRFVLGTIRPLCTLPCDLELPPGRRDLALYRGSTASGALHVFRGVGLGPELRFFVHYESRAADRTAGAVVLGTTIPVGVAFIVSSFFAYFVPFVATGSVITVVGIIVGAFFAGRRDHALLSGEPIRF